jgi:membrane-anchored mycosin MYCP
VAIYRGRVEAFHDDQLIVAIPELPVVTQALTELGVRWGAIDESAALGLARIRDLSGVGQATAGIAQDTDIGTGIRRFRSERADLRGGLEAADLEILIKALHLRLARRFPGWAVTIGRNFRPSLVKGDPHLGGGGQGNPKPTKAELTLPDSERGRGVRVGVLDTQLFPAKGLTGHYIARPGDLLNPGQGKFTVFDGHCAFVSSCILRQAPAAELHLHHVLDSTGDGSAWDAAEAMAQMAAKGLDVVNLSFGEFLSEDNTAPMVLTAAVKRFSPQTVVVAAAANNGDASELTPEQKRNGIRPNSASYPAALPDVVGVGSLDENGEPAAFTPSPAPWISLLAPGVGLIGAYVQGDVILESRDKDGQLVGEKSVSFDGRAEWEGNSFAAAVVTGEIAARTLPGRRSARQVLEDLLRHEPGEPGGGGIVPNTVPVS